jgi:hypothetical protein
LHNLDASTAMHMDQLLWDKIVQYDFDAPPSEYDFSTRLANENFWTKDFTELAILEYKKFMYLAATSTAMVSPSEIVDAVWHQHLIFTQSYQDFCTLIGKQVQHVPSTHSRNEFERFKQAKETTKQTYASTFGAQPKSIWEHSSMYDSLNLEKAKYKLRSFLVAGIIALIALTPLFYFLLRPIYVNIGSPNFMIGFIGLIIMTLLILRLYNRAQLQQIVNVFDKDSFMFKLHPHELVYLKTQNLTNVVNAVLNDLFVNQSITIKKDDKFEAVELGTVKSKEHLHAFATLKEMGKASYEMLLRKLIAKPVIKNTSNCMDAFKKYFIKSKKFGNLFYLNFIILSVVLMLGLIRMIIGMLRDKPVDFIAFALFVLLIIIISHLYRLTRRACTETIPNLYKQEILPAYSSSDESQWNYFLLGSAALSGPFAAQVSAASTSSDSSSSSSSCGSSCGSSCSSCGGCGGGD